MEANYGKKHRIFLQGIMSRGIMDFEAVKTLFSIAHAKVGEEEPDFKQLPMFIRTINNKLNKEELGIGVSKKCVSIRFDQSAEVSLNCGFRL